MKKFLSLILAVVMIMAMTVPVFAATEDEVAPCAVTCTSHTVNNPINTEYEYEYIKSGDGPNCLRITITYYECGNCHKIFSKPTAETAVSHVKTPVDASCNGTYQTVKYNCYHCGGYYYTDPYVPCGGAVHTPGNCRWLPV